MHDDFAPGGAVETSTSRTLDVDGYPFHYHDIGSGEPLVMFQAWGPQPGTTAWLSWYRVLPELSSHYRCLLIDLNNYGRSGPIADPEPPFTRDVRNTVKLLDALDISSAHVMGASTGGSAALVMAMDHPDRVRSVITSANHLPSLGYFPGILAPYPDETQRLMMDFEADPNRDTIVRFMRSMFYDESLATDELIDTIEGLFNASKDHWDAYMSSSFAMENRIDKLPNLTQPMLLIYGKYDRMVALEHALIILAQVPTADLVLLNRTGHWPPYESPQAFASHVLRFLDALPRSDR